MLNGLKEYVGLQYYPRQACLQGRQYQGTAEEKYRSCLERDMIRTQIAEHFRFTLAAVVRTLIKDGPPPIVSRHIAESELIHMHIYNKDPYFLDLDCNEKYYEEKLGPEI
jgi:hypothetical protein